MKYVLNIILGIIVFVWNVPITIIMLLISLFHWDIKYTVDYILGLGEALKEFDIDK